MVTREPGTAHALSTLPVPIGEDIGSADLNLKESPYCSCNSNRMSNNDLTIRGMFNVDITGEVMVMAQPIFVVLQLPMSTNNA